MMIPNIFLNYLSSYFIPYCSGKIPIFPKFPTPKLLPYFRMFLKNYTSTYALQHPHYLGNAIPRWKRQKYMNMILPYFHRINLKTMITRYFLKYILQSFPNIPSKNPFSIFWSPYQMILCIIYCMTSPF